MDALTLSLAVDITPESLTSLTTLERRLAALPASLKAAGSSASSELSAAMTTGFTGLSEAIEKLAARLPQAMKSVTKQAGKAIIDEAGEIGKQSAIEQKRQYEMYIKTGSGNYLGIDLGARKAAAAVVAEFEKLSAAAKSSGAEIRKALGTIGATPARDAGLAEYYSRLEAIDKAVLSIARAETAWASASKARTVSAVASLTAENNELRKMGEYYARLQATSAMSAFVSQNKGLTASKSVLQGAIGAITVMPARDAGLAEYYAQLEKLNYAFPVATRQAGLLGVAMRESAAAAAAAGSAARTSSGHIGEWGGSAREAHSAARGLAGGLGQLWLTWGSTIPIMAGAALGASIKQTLVQGKDLEYQLTFVAALANESSISFDRFAEAIRGSMFAPKEAAEGMRALAQNGLSASESLQAIPEILRLATVGELSVSEAAYAATGIMHAFNLEVSDLGRIGDVFAKAAAVSNTSVRGMTEAMKQASTVGDIYGVTMEETAAALATMAKRNIEGSAAGTAFRNMMKELGAPIERVQKLINAMGLEFYDATKQLKPFQELLKELSEKVAGLNEKGRITFLNEMFGERGAKAINALISDYAEFGNILTQLNDKHGSFVTTVVSQLENTVSGKIKMMVNELSLSYGKAFEGARAEIMQTVEALRTLFSSDDFKSSVQAITKFAANLTEVLANNIRVIAALGAAYAGLSVINAVSGWMTGLAAGSGLAATAVAGTAKAFQTLFQAASFAELGGVLRYIAVSGFGALTASLTAATAASLSFLATPFGVILTTLAGTLAIGTKLWLDHRDALKSAKEYADSYVGSSADLVRSLEQESERLDKQIKDLRERNSLLAAGKNENLSGATQVASSLAKEVAAAEAVYDRLLRKQAAATEAAKNNKSYFNLDGEWLPTSDWSSTEEMRLQALSERLYVLRADYAKALEFIAKTKEQFDTVDYEQSVNKLRKEIAQLDNQLKQAGKGELKIDIDSYLGSMEKVQQGLRDIQTIKEDANKTLLSDAPSIKGIEDSMREQLELINGEFKLKQELLDIDKTYLEYQHKAKKLSEEDYLSAIEKLEIKKQELIIEKAIAQWSVQGQEPAKRQSYINEMNRAQAEIEGIKSNSDARRESTYASHLQTIANLDAELLGKQKNYADQWHAKWKASYEKLYNDLKVGASQNPALQKFVDEFERLYEVGNKVAENKDGLKSVSDTVAEIKTKFAEIEESYPDGFLNGLAEDRAKADVLREKIAELIEDLKRLRAAGADPGTLAALEKEIIALQKSSSKNAIKMMKDIEDGLVRALEAGFDNGKFSAKKFVDSVKQQLRSAAFKIVVQALIQPLMGSLASSLFGGSSSGGAGDVMNGVSGANTIYNASQGGGLYGSFATSSYGQALGLSTPTTAVTSFDMAGFEYMTNEMGLLASDASFFASTTAQTGASVMTTFGSALPYIAAALAVISMFSKESTPHVGGIGFSNGDGYSTPQGRDAIGTNYADPNQALSLGMMRSDWTSRWDQQTADAMGVASQGFAETLNKILKANGLDTGSGYQVGLAFSADGEDPARGHATVTDQAGNIIASYRDNNDLGKDPSSAIQRYLGTEVPQMILSALEEIDLNPLADSLLDSLDIEGLSADMANKALAWVDASDEVIAAFEKVGFSAEDVTYDLIKAMGGFDAAGAAITAMAQKIDAIKAAATSTSEMFAESIRSIKLDTLDDPGKYDYLDSEAARYRDILATLTDSEAISRYAEKLNGTIMQAWNLVPEEQRATKGQEYIDLLQSADDLALSRYAAAEDAVKQQAQEIAAAVKTAVSEAMAPNVEASNAVTTTVSRGISAHITVDLTGGSGELGYIGG